MAVTVTWDILTGGRMIITKAGAAKPEVSFEYTMATDDAPMPPLNKTFPYVLTPAEETTMNAFINKIIGLIQTAEGI